METRSNHAVLWLLAIFVGAPVVFFIAFNWLWAYSWRDTTPRGPLTAVSDWPEPIQDLHAALDASGADTSSFSVYLLYGQPGQVLSTVVCRIDTDDAGWGTITSKLDLQPIPTTDGIALYSDIVASSDSSWWPPTNSTSDYFASARLLAGDEADLYYAARDTKEQIAYVRYHFNF